MKFKEIILAIISIATTSTFAGLNKLTIHSRANCANNESISWHRGHYYTLLTVSDHLRNDRKLHSLSSEWEYTWRSANVHWGEGVPGGGWFVQAGHYIMVGNQSILLGFTTADGCNIYEGWWD